MHFVKSVGFSRGLSEVSISTSQWLCCEWYGLNIASLGSL